MIHSQPLIKIRLITLDHKPHVSRKDELYIDSETLYNDEMQVNRHLVFEPSIGQVRKFFELCLLKLKKSFDDVLTIEKDLLKFIPDITVSSLFKMFPFEKEKVSTEEIVPAATEENQAIQLLKEEAEKIKEIKGKKTQPIKEEKLKKTRKPFVVEPWSVPQEDRIS